VSCADTLRELHPPPPALLLSSCSRPLACLFLRVVYLSLPLFSLMFVLPCLALAHSATSSRPWYRRQGLLFPVWENLSPGYCRFVQSLHYLERMPSQTRIWLPRVSPVIGTTPPPCPTSLLLLLGYRYRALPWLAPYFPFDFPADAASSQLLDTLIGRIALSRWQISTPWVLP